MISKSLCMITYIYLSEEDVWQTKGFYWLNVKQVIILCNYLIFYGYFYILSPLSNVQAQFGTRWRVTTSMLFHIQGASMSENDLYFSINVLGCSLERIIQIGSNYREITWENCSNLTHENVNLLVIYYQNVCLLFLPAVHWLTDSWGSAMELPGWKWTNCLYFSLLLFIFIVIIIIFNKRMLLFSGKVKGNPKDTGEI